MTTQTTTLADLVREAEALSRVEHLVETNSGTYGAAEACRDCGTGEPRFADRCVYETVGGVRRETGADAARAPGRMRKSYETLGADRARLAELRRRIRKSCSTTSSRIRPAERSGEPSVP
jgi:hypothetical protein